MKNRNIPFLLFLHLNQAQDKLALRTVNKAFKNSLANSIPAPYQTKVDFCIAVDGRFTSKDFFQYGWYLYQKTIKSESTKTAILYKGEDYDRLTSSGTIASIAQGEDLHATSRIYYFTSNVGHSKALNSAWIVAHLHHQSAFAILSDLCPEENQDRSYFREMATAVKASYSLKLENGIFYLTPDVNKDIRQLRFNKFNVTDIEIKNITHGLFQEMKRQKSVAAEETIQKLIQNTSRAKL